LRTTGDSIVAKRWLRALHVKQNALEFEKQHSQHPLSALKNIRSAYAALKKARKFSFTALLQY
jgi:hypothetical protein